MRVTSPRLRLTLQLGVTQTIGYASSYYLSAILARPISEDLGFGFEQYFFFVAFASILGGLLGPILGKQIDRYGGRLVLPLSSVLFAAGLLLMATSRDPVSFGLAWLITGIAMAAGLYDAAFATVVEILGEEARRTIAGITLLAGFASTIGWPITAWIESSYSWREAILFWAVAHIVITLPTHMALPASNRQLRQARQDLRAIHIDPPSRSSKLKIVLTGVLFVFGGFVQIAMGAHLPEVIVSAGSTKEFALVAAAFLGPGQVLARLLQVMLPTRLTPVGVASLALALHPIGVLTLVIGGQTSFILFAFLHGMGSGFLTVAAGVLPLHLFGAANYGQRQGYIMAASDIVLSFAPAIFGLALVSYGVQSLSLTVSSSFIALSILAWLIAHHKRSI